MSIASLPASSALAGVIDQNQDENPTFMAAFSQGDLAQSFQQFNNTITGAGIFLQADVGTSDVVTITLYDALPNAGGSALASGSATGFEGSWVDVSWDAVNIAPDTTFFLVFTSATDTLGIAGSTDNPYDRGQVFANPGFQSFPTFDYTFRTFAVPAPASVALLGMGGLIVGRRRR